MLLPQVITILQEKCKDATGTVEVDVAVLRGALDGLQDREVLQMKVDELNEQMSMKPTVARKLAVQIKKLESDLEVARDASTVKDLERKVQKLELDLKQSYSTKNFTLKQGLLDLEKVYRNHIYGNKDMEELWSEVKGLLVEDKSKGEGATLQATTSFRRMASTRKRIDPVPEAAEEEVPASDESSSNAQTEFVPFFGAVQRNVDAIEEGKEPSQPASFQSQNGSEQSYKMTSVPSQRIQHDAVDSGNKASQIIGGHIEALRALFNKDGGPLFPGQPAETSAEARAELEAIQTRMSGLLDKWAQRMLEGPVVPGSDRAAELETEALAVLGLVKQLREKYGGDSKFEKQMSALMGSINELRISWGGRSGLDSAEDPTAVPKPLSVNLPSGGLPSSDSHGTNRRLAHTQSRLSQASAPSSQSDVASAARIKELVAYFMSFMQSRGYVAMGMGDWESPEGGTPIPPFHELFAQFNQFLQEETGGRGLAFLPGSGGSDASQGGIAPRPLLRSDMSMRILASGGDPSSLDGETASQRATWGTDAGSNGGVSAGRGWEAGSHGGASRDMGARSTGGDSTTPRASHMASSEPLPTWMKPLPNLRIDAAAGAAGMKGASEALIVESALPATPAWWQEALSAAGTQGDKAITVKPAATVASARDAGSAAPDAGVAASTEVRHSGIDSSPFDRPHAGDKATAASGSQGGAAAMTAGAHDANITSTGLATSAEQPVTSDNVVTSDKPVSAFAKGAPGITLPSSHSAQGAPDLPFNPLLLPGPARTMQAICAHIRAQFADYLAEHPEAEALLQAALSAATELQGAQDRSLLAGARLSRLGTPSAPLSPAASGLGVHPSPTTQAVLAAAAANATAHASGTPTGAAAEAANTAAGALSLAASPSFAFPDVGDGQAAAGSDAPFAGAAGGQGAATEAAAAAGGNAAGEGQQNQASITSDVTAVALTAEDYLTAIDEMRTIATQHAEHAAALQELLDRLAAQHAAAVERADDFEMRMTVAVERADDLQMRLTLAEKEAAMLNEEIENLTRLLVDVKMAYAERDDEAQRLSARLKRSLQDEKAALDEVENLRQQLAIVVEEQVAMDAEYEAAMTQALEVLDKGAEALTPDALPLAAVTGAAGNVEALTAVASGGLPRSLSRMESRRKKKTPPKIVTPAQVQQAAMAIANQGVDSPGAVSGRYSALPVVAGAGVMQDIMVDKVASASGRTGSLVRTSSSGAGGLDRPSVADSVVTSATDADGAGSRARVARALSMSRGQGAESSQAAQSSAAAEGAPGRSLQRADTSSYPVFVHGSDEEGDSGSK